MISSPIPPHPPHAPLLFCSCSALYSLTFGRGTCCGGPPQPAAMTTTSYVVAIANCRLPGSVGVDRDFPFPPVRSNSMERQESTPALGSLSTIISPVFRRDFALPQLVPSSLIAIQNHGKPRSALRKAHCSPGPLPSGLVFHAPPHGDAADVDPLLEELKTRSRELFPIPETEE